MTSFEPSLILEANSTTSVLVAPHNGAHFVQNAEELLKAAFLSRFERESKGKLERDYYRCRQGDASPSDHYFHLVNMRRRAELRGVTDLPSITSTFRNSLNQVWTQWIEERGMWEIPAHKLKDSLQNAYLSSDTLRSACKDSHAFQHARTSTGDEAYSSSGSTLASEERVLPKEGTDNGDYYHGNDTSDSNDSKWRRTDKVYCSVHGYCWHNSAECRTLQDAIAKEIQLQKESQK